MKLYLLSPPAGQRRRKWPIICEIMTVIYIKSEIIAFQALLEEKRAPLTCKRFLQWLPYKKQVIHSRWSGEAVWIPLGDTATGLDFENHTSHPSRGDILLYSGGFSETEFLFAYGHSCFTSKMGQLAGNHFLTVGKGRENLQSFGEFVLWKGAQEIIFSLDEL